MQGEIVARSYASALFELGQRDSRIEEFGDALREIARLLDELPDLRLFLETPRIAPKDKKRVLREAFAERIPGPVLNFVLLTVDKRRQRLLRAMNREYQLLVDEQLGRAHVEVALAREPEPATLDKVKERLSSVLGKEVIPHVRVVPELLGGIVFRSGDTVFDGSVRRRLNQMKRRLLTAEVSTTE